MPELSDIDFKILEFISKNEPVEIEKIKSEFPDILSIDYRIGQMSEMDFNEASHCYLPNTSFIAQEYEKPTSSFETKNHWVFTELLIWVKNLCKIIRLGSSNTKKKSG